MTGMSTTPPIATFYRAQTTVPVTITELNRGRALKVEELCKLVGNLHPVVQEALQTNRSKGRKSPSKGSLPNFTEGDFVLVAREDFHTGEKLCLRWRGPRRVVKPDNNYVHLIEDLRNGSVDEVHVTRLKFYHDASLDTDAIISHVTTSETGMILHCLQERVDTDKGIKVRIRWRGLPDSEDTLEPLLQVYEDVPQLLLNLLRLENTSTDLAAKARRELHL